METPHDIIDWNDPPLQNCIPVVKINFTPCWNCSKVDNARVFENKEYITFYHKDGIKEYALFVTQSDFNGKLTLENVIMICSLFQDTFCEHLSLDHALRSPFQPHRDEIPTTILYTNCRSSILAFPIRPS